MSAQRIVLAAALALIASALQAAAEVATGAPAALLVFPLIQVDDAAGVDSLVQLTNTDGAEVSVRCLYEDAGGDPAFTPFTIHLGANQPVAWRAGVGLESVPGEGGMVPALGAAFSGALRCVAVDASGIPAERNVLAGIASIERASSTPAVQLDAARYNATGFDALPGRLNGDEQLVLGGEDAEYAACPDSLLLQTFFDGALLDLGAGSGSQQQISTTLALITCAQTPGGTDGAVLTLTTTNELGLRFSTGRSFDGHDVVELSRIDTNNPSRSIFSAQLQGTLTGSVAMASMAGSAGVLALAVLRQADPSDATRFSSAAISPQLVGERMAADVVDLVVPTVVPTACLGDCDDNGSVAINELITGVGIALGNRPLSVCPAFDGDDSDSVAINELVTAVNHALAGCP